MEELEILRRRLERERQARKTAEAFIEGKSRELYLAQQDARQAFEALQRQTASLDTAYKELEREISRRVQVEEIERDRLRIMERIARGHTLDAILEDLVRMAERHLPGGRCSIVTDADDYELAARDESVLTELGASRTESLDGEAPAGTPILRRIHVIEDAAKDPFWAARWDQRLDGLQCCWSMPVAASEGPALGVLAMHYAEQRTPGALDAERMNVLGGLAALAIGHRFLAHHAQHDVLTGLPNRFLFHDRLKQALAQSGRRGSMVGLLFIDLDGFKQINDTSGHDHGDEVLIQVSRRIKSLVRQGDTFARIGGDEFMVVLTSLRRPQDAALVAQKCLDALRAPIRFKGRSPLVSASIGVSIFPDDAHSSDELLHNADVAMYAAKTRGRNGFQFFTADLNTQTRERTEMERQLRKAIENEELALLYQPQIRPDGTLSGFEALIRWRHSTLGLIRPGEFIPLAEECGLIVPIGEWVLEEACRQLVVWHQAGHENLTMAVNVSAVQFETDDWVETVDRALSRTGLSPAFLELELTESLLMRNVEETAIRLNQLRKLGVRIAIDDFGTGYSSLAYLQRLPIDVLKIDQSFVRDLGPGASAEQKSGPIIRAIIALARSLGLALVAEGVETEPQAAFLCEHGCDTMQGYYFAEPLPPESCAALLRQTQERCSPARGATRILPARSHVGE